MRIGLNGTCFDARPSGANQRFRGLYGALIRQCPDIEFVIYESRNFAVSTWFADASNVMVRKTCLKSGVKRGALGAGRHLHGMIAGDRLDLYNGFNLPLVDTADCCPSILTVHDLRRLQPERPLLVRSAYALFLRKAFARAACIITVSQAIREEILAFMPQMRVEVVYNGVDAPASIPEMHRPDAPPGGVAAVDRVPLILSVGHLEQRKNFPALVEAVARLRLAKRSVKLAIVGRDNGARHELLAAIARCRVADDVTIFENIGEAGLRELYRAASVFVMPSTYEGFGIPILEAMAAGTPMALSAIPAFTEITQCRGRYFDPSDPADISRVVVQIIDNPSVRKDLVDYGYARVGDFRFDALARQLEAIMRETVRIRGYR
ncbi:glycosyltransferase family 4 protein [Pararhizobium mangrovi]|uniref:Glycosyltransferase family 4 protein n=1 Tax=Pararhizobium mangrovi TaxID=2590452 RepID=A0A506UB26_9HYPH|nr:glycosyltransferase family 1 protein [Pararhizobium mangrovi]TPW29007.1 glycosyltransferase family 4 protein [Pararhizobium mangrovi]